MARRMLLALPLCLLLWSSRAVAGSPPPVVREGSFAAGGVVILDVNIGDVRIEPATHTDTVRLVIAPQDTADAAAAAGWIREFSLNGAQAKIELHTPKQGQHQFGITLYVPARSDLRVDLGVGNLNIAGVTGNADANVGVGNLQMALPEAHAYREVSLSVRIGNVDSGPLGLNAHGLLSKSVQQQLPGGRYRLKLHTGIGNVECTVGD